MHSARGVAGSLLSPCSSRQHLQCCRHCIVLPTSWCAVIASAVYRVCSTYSTQRLWCCCMAPARHVALVLPDMKLFTSNYWGLFAIWGVTTCSRRRRGGVSSWCAVAMRALNHLLGRRGGAGPGLHTESASSTAAHVQLTCRRAQALCSPRRLVEARSRGAKPESPATASVPTASTWLMHLRHHGCVRGVCSLF